MGFEVDGRDTLSCPVVEVSVSSAEYSGSVAAVAVAKKS
jgi:hypothetical protein